MLEFLIIQMLRGTQKQDERNLVEVEEQRLHYELMLQQQKMMMLLVPIFLRGQGSSVTNLTTCNLSIENLTQMPKLPVNSQILVALTFASLNLR